MSSVVGSSQAPRQPTASQEAEIREAASSSGYNAGIATQIIQNPAAAQAASTALEAPQVQSQGSNLVATPGGFTYEGRMFSSREELLSYVESEYPGESVSLSGNQLTISQGAVPGYGRGEFLAQYSAIGQKLALIDLQNQAAARDIPGQGRGDFLTYYSNPKLEAVPAVPGYGRGEFLAYYSNPPPVASPAIPGYGRGLFLANASENSILAYNQDEIARSAASENPGVFSTAPLPPAPPPQSEFQAATSIGLKQNSPFPTLISSEIGQQFAKGLAAPFLGFFTKQPDLGGGAIQYILSGGKNGSELAAFQSQGLAYDIGDVLGGAVFAYGLSELGGLAGRGIQALRVPAPIARSVGTPLVFGGLSAGETAATGGTPLQISEAFGESAALGFGIEAGVAAETRYLGLGIGLRTASIETEENAYRGVVLSARGKDFPIIGIQTEGGSRSIAVGTPTFESPSVLVKAPLEGNPQPPNLFPSNLEVKIQQNALTNAEPIEREFFETGYQITGGLRNTNVPAPDQFSLELRDLSPAQNAALAEEIKNPEIASNILVYGSATVRAQVGEEFRLGGDIDVQFITGDTKEATGLAQKIASRLSSLGEGEFEVPAERPLSVFKVGGEKIADIHPYEEISGANIPEEIKLGFRPLKPVAIEELKVRAVGQTLVDKAATTLTPRINTEEDFFFAPTARRVKDVGDVVSISRILSGLRGGKLSSEIDRFEQLAISKGLIGEEGAPETVRLGFAPAKENIATPAPTRLAIEQEAAPAGRGPIIEVSSTIGGGSSRSVRSISQELNGSASKSLSPGVLGSNRSSPFPSISSPLGKVSPYLLPISFEFRGSPSLYSPSVQSQIQGEPRGNVQSNPFGEPTGFPNISPTPNKYSPSYASFSISEPRSEPYSVPIVYDLSSSIPISKGDRGLGIPLNFGDFTKNRRNQRKDGRGYKELSNILTPKQLYNFGKVRKSLSNYRLGKFKL